MDNVQFRYLQLKIQSKQRELEDLQKKYKGVTGIRFISGQRINDAKLCDGCRHNCMDGFGWFCNCEESEFYEGREPINGCSEWDDE